MIKLTRRPRTAKIQHKIVRDEVRKRLGPVAKAAEQSRARVVSNWRNRPKFKSVIQVTTKAIAILTEVRRGHRLPGSSATVTDLWKWIDRTGTKAHIIKPKKPGGFLAFQRGNYSPKTRPIARSGGPGRVTGGGLVSSRRVEHPGFPPRRFSPAIDAKVNDKFQKAVKNGYRAGARKLKSQ